MEGDRTTDQLNSIAEEFLREVVKAEFSMHHLQIQAWAEMAKHPPKGVHIPDSILQGWTKNRYLGISSLELDVYLKHVSTETYWQRFKLGWSMIFGKKPRSFMDGQAFAFARSKDKDAQRFRLSVKRDEQGMFKKSVQKMEDGELNSISKSD